MGQDRHETRNYTLPKEHRDNVSEVEGTAFSQLICEVTAPFS